MANQPASLAQQLHDQIERNKADLNGAMHGALTITFAHGAVTKVELLKRVNIATDPNAALSGNTPMVD